MRTDSCRSCGVTMKEFQRCTVCHKTNKFICSHCNRASDEQVHMTCGFMTSDVILN